MEGNGAAAILLQYKEGSTRAYDVLTSHLADPNIQEVVLLQCLVGLKDCVSLLGRQNEDLVGVVLKVEWITKTSDVITAYQDFIINLVSARSMYLRKCLKMIVSKFIPNIVGLTDADGKLSIDNDTRLQHQKNFVHLHNLLRKICTLAPLTSTMLFAILEECFPFVNKDAYLQACYVENLLTVLTYLPKLKTNVLELIVDKIMKLDVRSPRHVIEESQDISDDEEEDMEIFAMETDSNKDKKEAEVKDDVTDCEPRPMTLAEANSLDAIMFCLFSHIRNTCYKDEKLDWEATKKLYRELLVIFDRIILPTHATSHVQYIMFYICSFKELLVEGFLDYLWKKVCNPNTQPVFRQAAVAYIASLLARAKYIPTSTSKACLDLMVTWVHTYIQRTADTCTSADVTHHGPFYSVCQAIFYVFAFRHKELLAMPNGYKYCQSLNLQTIVTSRLNPLKACLPVVARIFSATARHHQLCYCDSILEKNRRQALPEAKSSNQISTATHENPLDSFFPFDPYLLVRSAHFIKHMYQEFEGTVEEDDSESEDEDVYQTVPEKAMQIDFELEHSLNEKGKLMARSPTELLMYGISPGFRQHHH